MSNNNYTIQKIGIRYTQTLHLLEQHILEQRIPDVTVQSKEYLPEPDVKVAHNEWYATSTELNCGKQIDELTTSTNTNENEQPTTTEIAHANDATAAQQEETYKNAHTVNAEPTSSDFPNLTTNVGDNPNIRRPHSLKVHLSPLNLLLQLLVITREKQRNTIRDLIVNLMLIHISEDLTL